ncbi:glycine cleavage system protein R [Microbacterium kyungheense]|jgi:glycine cleavage system regulatory protein|uniref:Glycine cleavage system regulatory protein n=1 Tax=Microbacterium kyungheense TaxID=1263636 RepID=A0A543ERT2_9MICO|nr:ACT domain-containing protein [Microbacterium kyungheense]TQM24275.1 glycine cleavage system regulatory protein [Microbacterium kyungheense]
MTTLVLTVVGDDRSGLVAAVADVVGAHGGNWETSQLAELSGAFAGIIEVSVARERADDLRTALASLEGLLKVTVHAGTDAVQAASSRSSLSTSAAGSRPLTLEVVGNDRAGIVRDISAVLTSHGVTIDRMATRTTDAAMYGGRLFEATVAARVPASVDLDALTAELERLATEIQVDVTLGA